MRTVGFKITAVDRITPVMLNVLYNMIGIKLEILTREINAELCPWYDWRGE